MVRRLPGWRSAEQVAAATGGAGPLRWDDKQGWRRTWQHWGMTGCGERGGEGHLLCVWLGPLVERDIKWEDGGLTGDGCSGGGER